MGVWTSGSIISNVRKPQHQPCRKTLHHVLSVQCSIPFLLNIEQRISFSLNWSLNFPHFLSFLSMVANCTQLCIHRLQLHYPSKPPKQPLLHINPPNIKTMRQGITPWWRTKELVGLLLRADDQAAVGGGDADGQTDELLLGAGQVPHHRQQPDWVGLAGRAEPANQEPAGEGQAGRGRETPAV